jgi:hypothetical protein
LLLLTTRLALLISHTGRRAVKKLPTATPIHLMQDDFDLITEGGELCNEEGEFSCEQVGNPPIINR